MTKINLPEEMLGKDAFKILPAKEKEEYVRNLLKKILELNSEGITTSQIKEATSLNYSTVWHHLEMLSCTGQCDKMSHGNMDVYHNPGKFEHLNDHDHQEKVHYTIGINENNNGKYVSIQEKRQNRLGNHVICRGISIPIELIKDIAADLSKIKDAPVKAKAKN